LDPHGELEDYCSGGKNALVVQQHEEMGRDGGDDGLEREYGTDATNAIREHLSLFRARLDSASRGGYYSPLDNVEGQ
jgi:hypothetical protein